MPCKLSLTHSFILVLVAVFSLNTSAYETDQYTVSPQPLADIGEDLSTFIHMRLKEGVDEINHLRADLPRTVEALRAEAARAEDFASAVQRLTQAEELERQLSTQAGQLKYLFQKYSLAITWNDQRDGVFGIGLSYAQYPNDLKNGKVVSYTPDKLNTIYSYSGFHRIISPSYFVFASTVNVYGTSMGVDKIGHLFNQGYEYSEAYEKHLNAGLAPSKALRHAIDLGVEAEDGLFGMLVDGVYSNADLAANFAGFMFYQNLFHDMNFRGATHRRIIEVDRQGNLALSRSPENGPRVLMKRFISEHLDESINPNILERLQREPVRRAIRARCASWLKAYGSPSKQQLIATIDRTKLWFGYDYGRRSEESILPQEECF
ncbi:MAG: hypothetical protein JNJ49_05710 [Bdellovibrionaceae bacterium]|nr:hypothetical protein [Pseudobdellovibrionaceae bacterium]